MVGKKAFVRTVEAAIAITITFIFVSLVLPYSYNIQNDPKGQAVLPELAKDPSFRQCVISENMSCINTTLSQRLGKYHFSVNLSKTAYGQSASLPQKRVFSESAFIAGNSSLYEPRIIRIYYWGKQ